MNKYIVKVNDIEVPVSKEVFELVECFKNELEPLQQENQQLKDKLNCDLQWALKYDELFEENKKLKSVIDEVRECIKDEKFKIDDPTDYYFNCELIELHNLLEILDKAKGE